MSSGNKHIDISPVAGSVPYDDQNIPTNLGEDVQTALDNLYTLSAISASPGFTWGNSGNTPSGTWLTNDQVPSNRTGRIFPLFNGKTVQLAVSNEVANTCTIQLYEHDGTTFTLLTSVSLTAQRSNVVTVSVNITQGKELACFLSSGSAKNPIVQLIAKGTSTP